MSKKRGARHVIGRYREYAQPDSASRIAGFGVGVRMADGLGGHASLVNWKNLKDDKKAMEVARRILSVRAQKARTSLVDFTEFVMKEQTTRKPIRVSPHQRVMLDFMQHHDRCVVMCPVGHGKTYSTAAMTLDLLGKDPTTRGVIVSATQGQAEKPLSVVSDYILHSPELKLVYPKLLRSRRRGDPWTQTAITIDRPHGIPDASLYAVGAHGSIQGARISWAIVDDFLNYENTRTKEARDDVRVWFDNSVLSRLDRFTGRIVVNNTAWHNEDILHELEKLGWPTLRMDIAGNIQVSDDERLITLGRNPWTHKSLRPASKSPSEENYRLREHDPDPNNETPLWPERNFYIPETQERKPATNWDEAVKMAHEHIAELRTRHLPSEFNRMFMNQCRDDGTAMCKLEWIEECKRKARERKYFAPVGNYDGENPTFTGVDLAFRKGQHADYTALFTFEVFPDGHRRVLDVEFGQWDAPTITDKVVQKHQNYNSMVAVEDNAAQKAIIDFLKNRDVSLPIKSHTTTGKNKSNLDFGVQSIFVELMNGAWLIPNDKHGKCHPSVQEWVNQCLYYSPSTHTGDILMSSWIGRELARKCGVLRRLGNQLNGFTQGAEDIGMQLLAR